MDPLEYQPSIFPFGLRIDQPVTAITDLPVAIVCFYAFYKIGQWKQNEKISLFFRLYFLFLGIGTLWAGFVSHAFLYALGDLWKVPGWFMTLFSITMICLASIEFTKDQTSKRTAMILNSIVLIELLIVAYLTLSSLNFKWARFYSAFGLLGIVAPLHGWAWWKNQNQTSQLILLAILTFVISGFIFLFKLSLHLWFNHVDATHLMLAVVAYIFYVAVKQLEIK